MDIKNNNELTGYPSLDRPWLKYYSEEAINAPLPEGTIYDYMMRCNETRLDCVALRYFGRTITHREFLRRIELCARALAARGVKRGDIVSVCMLTMPETLVLLYAINYVGAICAFLILNATEQELHKHLMQTESRCVFAVDLAVDKVVEAAKGTAVKEIVRVPLSASMPLFMSTAFRCKAGKRQEYKGVIDWEKFLKSGKSKECAKVAMKSSDIAVLEYTSGTTGESKGVMLSNQSVNTVPFHYKNSATVFEFHSGEKFLCIVPPFLSVGLITTLVMPLCLGFELILIPNPEPGKTAKNVIKYRPNHLCGGSFHISNLMDSALTQAADLSFLSTVAYGGDKNDSQWEQSATKFFFSHGMKHELVNGYGLTETASSCCTTTHKTNFMIPFFKNNILIRGVDSDEELRYGEEGEICISGPGVMEGYYKNPQATAELIFTREGIRWLRTGDLGMVTEDGALHVTGRLKRIAWAKGDEGIIIRIYPMQIEETICRYPGVARCAVVCLCDSQRGYVPVAFVVPQKQDADRDALQRDIMALIRQKLNSVSQPQAIHFLDSLPATRAGKIDYKALEVMAAEEV